MIKASRMAVSIDADRMVGAHCLILSGVSPLMRWITFFPISPATVSGIALLIEPAIAGEQVRAVAIATTGIRIDEANSLREVERIIVEILGRAMRRLRLVSAA